MVKWVKKKKKIQFALSSNTLISLLLGIDQLSQ